MGVRALAVAQDKVDETPARRQLLQAVGNQPKALDDLRPNVGVAGHGAGERDRVARPHLHAEQFGQRAVLQAAAQSRTLVRPENTDLEIRRRVVFRDGRVAERRVEVVVPECVEVALHVEGVQLLTRSRIAFEVVVERDRRDRHVGRP